MKWPSVPVFLVAGSLATLGPAFGQLEYELEKDKRGVQVLFAEPVRVSSVEDASVRGWVVTGEPRRLLELRLEGARRLDAAEMSPTDELFVLTFEDLNGRPAFADTDGEYEIVIEGVLSANGRPIDKQTLTFRQGKPTLAFVERTRLWLSEEQVAVAGERFDRFGGRRYVEVRAVTSQLDPTFVKSLEPYRRTLGVASGVRVEVSADKIDYRDLLVAAASVNGEIIRLYLGEAFPKGQAFYARVSLPKQDGSQLVVKNAKPHTFAAPKGRDDSSYFVDLSYVSAATTDDAEDDRDEEGLLDLRLKPGPWSLFDSGRGAWKRCWQPLLDAKIGSDRPSESKSPNKVSAGLELQFDRAVGRWGEHRIRFGLLHNSDRDFDTREVAADLRWLPVADSFVRSEERRLHEYRERNPRKTPVVRGWSFVPFLGVEYGEVLDSPPPAMPEATAEDDQFLRYKLGFDLSAAVGSFVLSLSDTFRLLEGPAGDPADDRQNILTAAVTFQISAIQGVSLKYQKGNDVPTFDDVDTLSVSYQFKY